MTEHATTLPELVLRLDEAIQAEERLGVCLHAQEQALLAGVPAGIDTVNAGLDEAQRALAAAARECRTVLAEAAGDLGLPPRTRLKDLMERLPAGAAAELEERRRRLRDVRRVTRERSSRNAAIARCSLDAIATVRGILGRAAPPPARAAAPGSDPARLDARV